MKMYVLHDVTGKILRTGVCSNKEFKKEANEGEFILEGIADDRFDKIVDGEIVTKTPEEIEVDNPLTVPQPFEDRIVSITNKQWQDVLDRLNGLENL